MNPFEGIVTPEQLVAILQQSVGGVEVPKENLRYAIYVRKSTDSEDNQERSLGDQLDECKKLASSHGIIVLDENIVQESESAKESGIRPQYRKLINRIVAGELDAIIAWHPNRLTRNMLEAGEIIDLLDKQIIKDLKFPSHTFVNDASGKMLLGIVFVMAKQYSEQLSADIKRGNQKSIEAGDYINTPKHGYIKDNNKKLRPDQGNWAIIKQAFQMRLEGQTLESIVKYVRDSGYFGRGKDNREIQFKMSLSTMANIFTDPFYAGVLQYGKQHVNLTDLYDFMPMITVKEHLSINKYDSIKEAFRPRRSQRSLGKLVADFLPQHVYCSHCEGHMQAGISKGKTKQYYYFRCQTPECERYNKGTRAKVVIDFVVDFLAKHPFASKSSYQSYRQEIIRIQNQGLSELNSQIASAKKKNSLMADDIAEIKLNLSKEKDIDTKTIQKQELKRLESELLAGKKMAEELLAKKAKINKAPLTFEEFIDVMEALPAKIKKVQSTSGKHELIAPVFLNFFVSAKNVEKYGLKSPFNKLIADDFSKCGDGGNRTPVRIRV
ncbi:recombinase family protein [Candidatus Kaiserbacteria bacterium]|nr:recombinase family protein [Candidatus Kaiserbacteria bacterium]